MIIGIDYYNSVVNEVVEVIGNGEIDFVADSSSDAVRNIINPNQLNDAYDSTLLELVIKMR